MRRAMWLSVVGLGFAASGFAAQEQARDIAAPPPAEQQAAPSAPAKPEPTPQPTPAPVEPPAETAPAEPPAALPSAAELPAVPVTDSQRSICMLLESAARTHGLPLEYFARVIWQESRFRPDAVGPVTRSGRRAQGIAQFMPGTAAERNLLNPFDPIQALPKSAEFLRELHGEFGNLGLAAAAYNAGPRRVREWLTGTGYMPSETRAYVQAITGASVEHWAKANANARPGSDPDRSQHSGPGCGQLMAMLRRAPSPFMVALEHRVVLGVMRPWGVIVGADNSRDRMLVRYAELQRRHSGALEGRDPILLDRRRGPLPRYQVRIGTDTRTEANALCDRIHKSGGDCVVLRNPRT